MSPVRRCSLCGKEITAETPYVVSWDQKTGLFGTLSHLACFQLAEEERPK
jgi:hypothetical protein